MNCKTICSLLTVAMAMIITNVASAQSTPATTTTINVEGMHCQSCAAKLTQLLGQVPGVASANADARSGTASVVPADPNRLPSPRAQWEAVEQAGYRPVRLAGPFGVFTSKPQR